MSKLLQKNYLIRVFQGFLLGGICLWTAKTNANPTLTFSLIEDSKEATKELSIPEITSSRTINEIPKPLLNSSCPNFSPITNTIKPNQTSLDETQLENSVIPNSSCAADLVSQNPLNRQLTDQDTETPKPEETPPTESSPEISPNTSKETPVVESKDWHIDIRPYVTIPVTTYGQVTIGNRSVNYHLGLGELLDVLRVTASGRIEAWKGDFGLIFDGYYASLHGTGIKQVERPIVDSTIESTLKFDQGIYDFALSYRLGSRPIPYQPTQPSKGGFPRIWFTPILGTRLNDISSTIQTTISFNRLEKTFEETHRASRTWFEPMVGGELGLQVAKPIILWARGDVSGFGLAGDTDLSWNAIFGLDWWVKPYLSLNLAYRFYQMKYGNGSGNNAFEFEENFNGPYLGVTFRI